MLSRRDEPRHRRHELVGIVDVRHGVVGQNQIEGAAEHGGTHFAKGERRAGESPRPRLLDSPGVQVDPAAIEAFVAESRQCDAFSTPDLEDAVAAPENRAHEVRDLISVVIRDRGKTPRQLSLRRQKSTPVGPESRPARRRERGLAPGCGRPAPGLVPLARGSAARVHVRAVQAEGILERVLELGEEELTFSAAAERTVCDTHQSPSRERMFAPAFSSSTST